MLPDAHRITNDDSNTMSNNFIFLAECYRSGISSPEIAITRDNNKNCESQQLAKQTALWARRPVRRKLSQELWAPVLGIHVGSIHQGPLFLGRPYYKAVTVYWGL